MNLAGDDSQAKAKVEAAYDAVLMGRLRDRQQVVRSVRLPRPASQKEESGEAFGSAFPASACCSASVPHCRIHPIVPDWRPPGSLVEGQGLVVRLVLGGFALLLLIFSVNSGELVLSLAVIGCFISNSRRGRRALPALGWSLLPLLLACCLGTRDQRPAPQPLASQSLLTADQVQSLPALLLLWLGGVCSCFKPLLGQLDQCLELCRCDLIAVLQK